MYKNSLEFARRLDENDELRRFRERFHIPISESGESCIYLCGNSLGVQPRSAMGHVDSVMKDWERMGVDGYFRGNPPWVDYAESMKERLAHLVGASASEVCIMNTLTVNLNLLMVSFYQPTPYRFKIVIEENAFPSDQYAMRQQILFHGFDPEEALIVIKSREGEESLRTEDILETLEQSGSEIALVMMGGINYYTGQLFDLARITGAARELGCSVGWDLAHAVGNVPLKLHDWNPDFAVWCHYKYMNAGPAAPGGAFVHERHAEAFDLPRFSGWWGHNRKTRFQWGDLFEPERGAAGWQMTNSPVLSTAPLRASLEIFDEAGMPALRKKSERLSGYLRFLLGPDPEGFDIMTPPSQAEHGAQLSLRVHGSFGKRVFDELQRNHIICDWRNPNCIRASPAPLYNSFEDVYRFANRFVNCIDSAT